MCRWERPYSDLARLFRLVMLNAEISGTDIIVPADSFSIQGISGTFQNSVIVYNKQLEFPFAYIAFRGPGFRTMDAMHPSGSQISGVRRPIGVSRSWQRLHRYGCGAEWTGQRTLANIPVVVENNGKNFFETSMKKLLLSHLLTFYGVAANAQVDSTLLGPVRKITTAERYRETIA